MAPVDEKLQHTNVTKIFLIYALFMRDLIRESSIAARQAGEKNPRSGHVRKSREVRSSFQSTLILHQHQHLIAFTQKILRKYKG